MASSDISKQTTTTCRISVVVLSYGNVELAIGLFESNHQLNGGVLSIICQAEMKLYYRRTLLFVTYVPTFLLCSQLVNLCIVCRKENPKSLGDDQ